MASNRKWKIHPNDLEGISELIGYGATAWARGATLAESATSSKPHMLVEDDSGRLIAWDVADLEAMVKKYMDNPEELPYREYLEQAYEDRDKHGFLEAAEFDSAIADCLLQFWAFDEIVYG
jgi:hypothetical protein